MDPNELAQLEKDWDKSAAAQVLTETLNAMPKLSEAIAVSYFAHSRIARAGGEGGGRV
jgi:hypothetical protein